MHLDISLSFVNVGMPLSMQDKEKGLKEGHSLYLIKPLDVKVRVSLFIVRVFCYYFDFSDYLLYVCNKLAFRNMVHFASNYSLIMSNCWKNGTTHCYYYIVSSLILSFVKNLTSQHHPILSILRSIINSVDVLAQMPTVF